MSSREQIPDALDYLQAEHEAAWLGNAYVAPADMAALCGMRSVAVFGESGAGKSALRLALAGPALRAGYLLVEWSPTLHSPALSADLPVRSWFAQLLDAALSTLLRQLGQEPDRLVGLAPWVYATLRWFVHTALLDMAADRELLLSRMTEGLSPRGATALGELLSGTAAPIFRPGTPETKLLAAFADMLPRLGFAAMWVVIDDLEWLLEEDAGRANELLRGLLSTQGLFEAPHFAAKLLTPPAFEAVIMASGAVVRRRLDVHRLRWSEDQLAAIVERRVAALLGRPAFMLQDLYEPEQARAWFERFGAALPRGWLETARPAVELYQRLGGQRPLNSAEWEQLWRAHPPLLRVDLSAQRVFIGYREVLELSAGAQKLLNYLYRHRHRDRLCSREELYYCALLDAERIPQSADDAAYSAPKDWEGMLNTTLYRLRKAIEFEPERPLYVVARRGKGVVLENCG